MSELGRERRGEQGRDATERTCCASFIALPMTGMSAISLLLRYLNGRGTKPDITRMSMKDVWLGTNTTVSFNGGKFSRPMRRGKHKPMLRDILAQ